MLKNGKIAGPDGVPAEVLMNIKSTVDIFYNLFKRFGKRRTYQTNRKRFIIIETHKER